MTPLYIESRVLEIVRRLYLPQNVSLNRETRLFHDLKFDDWKLMTFIGELEHEFEPLTFPAEWINSLATVGGAIEMVERLKHPV